MSYDLLFRANRDLEGERVLAISSTLDAAAKKFGGELHLTQATSFLAGDALGWLRLPGGLKGGLNAEGVSILNELLLLGPVYGFDLYDPQRRELITEDDLLDLPTILMESAQRLVESRLSEVLEPYGFQPASKLRFTRALEGLFQHLIGHLSVPGDDTPGRFDLQAGWTVMLDDPQALTPEQVNSFTYLENIHSISGKGGRLFWEDLEGLEGTLNGLVLTLKETVLPWLEARRGLQDLLSFYEAYQSPAKHKLYFGSPPNSYWLLAQVYHSQGNQQAELGELKRFVQETTSGGGLPYWLANKVEQASSRIKALSE